MKTVKIQILLSTYNGSRFLRTQLDSLLAQDYPCFEILARDDGSTDDTCAILREYAARYPNLTYTAGENLGAMQSFFALMRKADPSAGYYAFCDQDDYWFPDKLSAAVRLLSEHGGADSPTPLLYCGKPVLADEQLNPLPVSIRSGEKIPSFGNALIENICYGCTAVVNRELLRLAAQTAPADAIMHDWWLYLLASCWGTVLYDGSSHLYYRQYSGNAVGATGTYRKEFFYRLRLFRRRKGRFCRQAAELERSAEQLRMPIPERERAMLRDLIGCRTSFRRRLSLIRNRSFRRQRRGDTAALKLCCLLGFL